MGMWLVEDLTTERYNENLCLLLIMKPLGNSKKREKTTASFWSIDTRVG